jgi:hypothetical protein
MLYPYCKNYAKNRARLFQLLVCREQHGRETHAQRASGNVWQHPLELPPDHRIDGRHQPRAHTRRQARGGRPQIITPDAYAQTALEGFGEEARQYIDWLREHEKDIRVLQYGYRLKQESYRETILSDNLDQVVDRVKIDVEASNDPLSAVVVGVDDPWDVCLVRLFWEVIQSSAVFNIREMQRHKLFEYEGGVPRGIRRDIDDAFKAASKDPGQNQGSRRTPAQPWDCSTNTRTASLPC